MAYEIEFDPEAVKDLKKLDRPVQQRIVAFLRERVATLDNPRQIGEAQVSIGRSLVNNFPN